MSEKSEEPGQQEVFDVLDGTALARTKEALLVLKKIETSPTSADADEVRSLLGSLSKTISATERDGQLLAKYIEGVRSVIATIESKEIQSIKDLEELKQKMKPMQDFVKDLNFNLKRDKNFLDAVRAQLDSNKRVLEATKGRMMVYRAYYALSSAACALVRCGLARLISEKLDLNTPEGLNALKCLAPDSSFQYFPKPENEKRLESILSNLTQDELEALHEKANADHLETHKQFEIRTKDPEFLIQKADRKALEGNVKLFDENLSELRKIDMALQTASGLQQESTTLKSKLTEETRAAETRTRPMS